MKLQEAGKTGNAISERQAVFSYTCARVVSDLTLRGFVLEFGPSVVGTRRMSHMKLGLEPNPESFRGQKPDKNRLPSDLIASRLREAALIFDIMKYGYKETRNR